MKLMCKAIFAGVALSSFVCVGAADAGSYRRDTNWFWRYNDERYCLTDQTGGIEDCAYPTYQSCLAAGSGILGTCSVNLRYVERSDAPPRKRVRRIPR